MKKNIFLFLFSVLLLSCSSDNDSASSSDSIVGKWQVVKFSDPTYYEACDYSGWVNIMEGGKYEDYDDCSKSKESGNWTQKDNLLTITSSSFPIPISAKIITLTKTSLVLETDFGNKETVTYKRI